MTRGSVRSRQSSWLWPTSSAMTLAAPRCSRTSVKPPVDAPTSSARRPARVDGERVERAGELQAAAADVRMIRHGELDARVGLDRRAGLRDDLAVDRHLAGEDQRARAFARRGEAAVDERDIEARLGRSPRVVSVSRRCSASNQLFRDTTQSAIAAEPAVRDPGVLERRVGALRGTRRPARASDPGRTAPGRSAWPTRRPCPRSCRATPASPSTSRMSSTIWNARPISPA